WHSTRTLSVTSPALTKSEKPPADEKDDPNKPIKFSTSPANHRTWTVARSMGSDHQRSLWKVLPFSVCCLSILLWCVLREETDDDQILENGHHEHSTENHEEQHVKEKPSYTLSADSTSQLDVFGHDGDTFGVDGTQIGVFEESHQLGNNTNELTPLQILYRETFKLHNPCQECHLQTHTQRSIQDVFQGRNQKRYQPSTSQHDLPTVHSPCCHFLHAMISPQSAFQGDNTSLANLQVLGTIILKNLREVLPQQEKASRLPVDICSSKDGFLQATICLGVLRDIQPLRRRDCMRKGTFEDKENERINGYFVQGQYLSVTTVCNWQIHHRTYRLQQCGARTRRGGHGSVQFSYCLTLKDCGYRRRCGPMLFGS
ncbi:hypothetical protein DNTS_032766, partial [Danionella cerebrum]